MVAISSVSSHLPGDNSLDQARAPKFPYLFPVEARRLSSTALSKLHSRQKIPLFFSLNFTPLFISQINQISPDLQLKKTLSESASYRSKRPCHLLQIRIPQDESHGDASLVLDSISLPRAHEHLLQHPSCPEALLIFTLLCRTSPYVVLGFRPSRFPSSPSCRPGLGLGISFLLYPPHTQGNDALTIQAFSA